MRYDLLVFVPVSWIFVLAGCASAPSTSMSSSPAIAHAAVPSARTVLLPLIVAPGEGYTPTAAPRTPATQTATPPPSTPVLSASTTPTPWLIVNSPTPRGYIAPAIPSRLLIPAINLDVPIVAAGWSIIEKDGQQVSEWDVPDWRAAGWLSTSALVGAPGNTVLEGHQDIAGRVFEHLEHVKEGDEIQVQTTAQTRTYVVALRMIVPEKNQPPEVRHENARWIGPSNDERLTLVTCWPRNDNTHRLILVALPAP